MPPNFPKRTRSSVLLQNEINEIEVLPHERTLELIAEAQKGSREAMKKIVEANLRFVRQLAQKYVKNGPFTLEDLVSEGSIGIMRAVGKFEPKKGFTFLTHANLWVKHYVFEAVNGKRDVIRIPAHLAEAIQTAKKTRRVLEVRFGRNVPDEELITSLIEQGLTKERAIFAIRQMNMMIVCSDEPVSNEGDQNILDMHPDSGITNDNTAEKLDENRLLATLKEILSALESREQTLIQERFFERRTLESIAVDLGISKSGTRLREQAILFKMRKRLIELGHDSLISI